MILDGAQNHIGWLASHPGRCVTRFDMFEFQSRNFAAREDQMALAQMRLKRWECATYPEISSRPKKARITSGSSYFTMNR